MTIWDERLASLRTEFDETFANAPAPRADTEDFLAVRALREPVALRLADVARVGKTPAIATVPTRRASVLGVASLRGALVAVHSLPVLLGRERDAHAWIAVLRGVDVAIAFGALDALVRAPRGTADVLRVGESAIPIVDLRALAQSLTAGPRDRQGA
ncbi:MAG TPA: chemotaxis protein CheW [Polyangiaceae bacterium]|jgi:hypothetical protein